MALSDRFTGCNSGHSAEQVQMSKILLQAPLSAPPPSHRCLVIRAVKLQPCRCRGLAALIMTPIHRYTPLWSSQSISVTVALCVAHQILAFITAPWLSAGRRLENVFRQNSDACSISRSSSFSSAKCCSDKNTNLYSLSLPPPCPRYHASWGNYWKIYHAEVCV